jgi:hypothetical protein
MLKVNAPAAGVTGLPFEPVTVALRAALPPLVVSPVTVAVVVVLRGSMSTGSTPVVAELVPESYTTSTVCSPHNGFARPPTGQEPTSAKRSIGVIWSVTSPQVPAATRDPSGESEKRRFGPLPSPCPTGVARPPCSQPSQCSGGDLVTLGWSAPLTTAAGPGVNESVTTEIIDAATGNSITSCVGCNIVQSNSTVVATPTVHQPAKVSTSSYESEFVELVATRCIA